MKATPRKRLRVSDVVAAKTEGRKLSMLTAYDSVTAPIFERAGIDMLLVGDSIGNVMLGYPGTLQVEISDMVRATGAVARSAKNTFVVADLPFGTYELDANLAFESAVALMKAGAQAVKLEGGTTQAHIVKALVSGGIPVMGHLGYTPQSEHALSGPRLQGRGDQAQKLVDDALALQEAGAFSVVLEMVPSNTATKVTAALDIPTIGIGAGPNCDGQVLVWSDMAGMTEWTPSFVHRFAELGEELESAATAYHTAVADGEFPTQKNYRQE